MVTIVYIAVIIMICSQLSEPIKVFMDSEAGQFWSEVIIYTLTCFLVVVMPIFGVTMTINIYKRDGFLESCFMGILTLVIGIVVYPFVTHTVNTIAESGLNLILLKETVSAMIDFKNTEPNLWGLWYSLSIFVLELTVTIIMTIGLPAFVMFSVIWGWVKAIKLVVDFPEEDDR
jgi:hypothetical protein